MDRERELPPVEKHPPLISDEAEGEAHTPVVEDPDRGANPPRTTTGKVTSPKFGFAGSGGVELEPGPERD
ncbi:MAG TPA: hypothetical protein VGP84_01445 [Gemmatimonadaceae bacterium]|nr:hypothetical protein [Gemmatimonadaceae bacterium]